MSSSFTPPADEPCVLSTSPINVQETLLRMEEQLNRSLKKELKFKKPIVFVYRPLDYTYAYKPHSVFTRKYAISTKPLLFLEMSPSSRGMCETGIPFGDIHIVKQWFNINEEVTKPMNEYQRVECVSDSETSGQRFWGLFKNICSNPENFFQNAYVYDYCPIAMIDEDGKNVPVPEIKKKTRKKLENLCDEALNDVMSLLRTEIIVGVGKLAEEKAMSVVKQRKLNVQVFYLPHPNSKIPNNQDWIKTAEEKLKELNIISYFKSEKL
ncbi:hypothetical protein FQR65_LT07658 [Abscondita terminalis]|nr:hypothetical protein FQR65_LT07658 [Abscondita terminalis]